MQLGTVWNKKKVFRTLKDKGSITFHILDLNIKREVTLWEDKKPIRENDPLFAEYAKKYEDLKQQEYAIKQTKDEVKIKEFDELLRKHRPSIRVSLNILNRDTESKEVLQTTQGVANQLNNYFLKGYTNTSHDYILENTGVQGINKYIVTPSPTKKAFTNKELSEIEDVSQEDKSDQVISTDDIPF